MNHFFEKAKLAIFDLDGTLYEGFDHFDYYANSLQEDVRQADKQAFMNDYKRMKNGEHPLKIGRGYDIVNDLILTIDPLTFSVVKVEDWYGKTLKHPNILDTYPSPIQFDFEKIIAIGDGWWLPFAAAKHYGVEDCYKHYVKTKKYMVTDEFKLEKITGVKEGIEELKKQTEIALVTNSDEDDVHRLLKELDLQGIFNHIVPSAQKPLKTDEVFNEVINQYDLNPEDVISVGDNFINDIAPALKMGMSAIYIDPVSHSLEQDGLLIVKSLSDCF